MTRLFHFYCYGNDPASFADAIRQALTRASQPEYPGKARAVAKQHSWDAIAKQLEPTILH